MVTAGGPAHPRLVRRAGDFFADPLPEGDTYLLMEVIHDWADAEAVAILTAVRRAASPDAKVLIIENILRGDIPDPRGRILDVIMVWSGRALPAPPGRPAENQSTTHRRGNKVGDMTSAQPAAGAGLAAS